MNLRFFVALFLIFGFFAPVKTHYTQSDLSNYRLIYVQTVKRVLSGVFWDENKVNQYISERLDFLNGLGKSLLPLYFYQKYEITLLFLEHLILVKLYAYEMLYQTKWRKIMAHAFDFNLFGIAGGQVGIEAFYLDATWLDALEEFDLLIPEEEEFLLSILIARRWQIFKSCRWGLLRLNKDEPVIVHSKFKDAPYLDRLFSSIQGIVDVFCHNVKVIKTMLKRYECKQKEDRFLPHAFTLEARDHILFEDVLAQWEQGFRCLELLIHKIQRKNHVRI